MQLFGVTAKFAPQLDEYLGQASMPEANEALHARIQKASTYFTEKITGLLQDANELSTVADNQAVAAALASQLQSLQLAFFVKRACFAACDLGEVPCHPPSLPACSRSYCPFDSQARSESMMRGTVCGNARTYGSVGALGR